MRILRVDRDRFFKKAKEIQYRNQDIREAFMLGCPKGVVQCFENANHHAAKYFIGYEDRKPKLAIILQRDGYLVFFISKNIKRKIALIKALKKIANRITKRCGAIYTRTANWYKEANRLNELIGFKKHILEDDFTVWTLE